MIRSLEKTPWANPINGNNWWRIEGDDVISYLKKHDIKYSGLFKSIMCSDPTHECWDFEVTDEESITMLKLMSFSR